MRLSLSRDTPFKMLHQVYDMPVEAVASEDISIWKILSAEHSPT
jgi:hypothetical protein